VDSASGCDHEALALDEPADTRQAGGSLDVSTQSEVINLLTDLQDRLVSRTCSSPTTSPSCAHLGQIAVMYLGRIIEQGAAESLRAAGPTPGAALRDPGAGPITDRKQVVLEGDVPSPLAPPSGCRFHPRCAYAMDVCTQRDPEPFSTPAGTVVACHLHAEGPVLAGAPVTLLARSAPAAGAGS
jgi:oligopeptide/dipeptide ABC transporter ATP-binding protein